jgi:hypothetical protein
MNPPLKNYNKYLIDNESSTVPLITVDINFIESSDVPPDETQRILNV